MTDRQTESVREKVNITLLLITADCSISTMGTEVVWLSPCTGLTLAKVGLIAATLCVAQVYLASARAVLRVIIHAGLHKLFQHNGHAECIVSINGNLPMLM